MHCDQVGNAAGGAVARVAGKVCNCAADKIARIVVNRQVDLAGRELILVQIDGHMRVHIIDDVLAAVADGAVPLPVQWVVIDAEAIGEVDSTGAAMLGDLADDLRGRGITLALARLKAPVAAYLSRAGVMEKIGAERVYLEVDDAVAAFRATSGHDGG